MTIFKNMVSGYLTGFAHKDKSFFGIQLFIKDSHPLKPLMEASRERFKYLRNEQLSKI